MKTVAKMITVSDIIAFVVNHKEDFPDGLNTPVLSGDLEGKYTHGYHFLQYALKDKHICANAVVLGYEPREDVARNDFIS